MTPLLWIVGFCLFCSAVFFILDLAMKEYPLLRWSVGFLIAAVFFVAFGSHFVR